MTQILFPVPFHEDMEQGLVGDISQPILEETKAIFQRLKKKADYYQVIKTKAVATETLRKARNRVLVVAEILGETGIKLEIIDQEIEDRLDLFTAIRTSQGPGKPVVWDIGGGEHQLLLAITGRPGLLQRPLRVYFFLKLLA